MDGMTDAACEVLPQRQDVELVRRGRLHGGFFRGRCPRGVLRVVSLSRDFRWLELQGLDEVGVAPRGVFSQPLNGDNPMAAGTSSSVMQVSSIGALFSIDSV